MADRTHDKQTPLGGVGTDVTLPQVTPSTPALPASGRVGSGGDDRNAPLRYKAGDLVAERYKVIRLIGEGGMGEVYEAEDLLLKERLALKTLRAPAADDETVVTRFKREIQLARKVTHPNVCRLFDVGIDRRGDREAAFLTMELLEGETLSAHVRQNGRMAPSEALPIAEQIASGLAAAHAVGIIHRDLKCANVILVAASTGTRAVVTDFGLARVAAEGSDQVTGDAVVGSPAYMAPEQVEGGRRLTGACDIYAFGVVLYEMVTGKLPFVGETPLATAVMRLREPPPSPRAIVPDLDARWERAILACLEREPEDRPVGAQEVVRILHGTSVPGPGPKPKPRPGLKAGTPRPPGLEAPRPDRRRRLGRAAMVLAVFILVAGGIRLANRHRQEARSVAETPDPPAAPAPPAPPGGDLASFSDLSKLDLPGVPKDIAKQVRAQVKEAMKQADQAKRQALAQLARVGSRAVSSSDGEDDEDSGDEAQAVTPAPAERRSVAILGFKNLSGKAGADYLSAAFAQMLATELMAGEELRTVPSESVARAKRQLHLVDADSYAKDTLAGLRKILDSDFVVTGSYIVVGDSGKIRLDLKLQDTRSGETISSIAQSGSEADLPELVAGAGERLRDALNVDQPSESERRGARGLRPKKGDAARQYAEGLGQMRLLNCVAARGALEAAVAADPSYALAHKALSEALNCLGYDGRALEEAEKAVALSDDLPPEVRLNTQAHLEQLTGDTEKALVSYQDLFKRFPDNFDYGMAVARGQATLGDAKAARKTLAVLRKLPPPAADNPEIDCMLAQLAVDAPLAERLVMVRKAKAKASEKGARLVEGEVLIQETKILYDMGRNDESLEAARQSTAIFQASGDRDGVILGLLNQAKVEKRKGDDGAVARLLAQATAIGKDLDSVRRLVDFHNMLGEASAYAGDLRAAQREFEASLRLLERHRSGAHIATALGPLALVAVYRGDAREAEELIARAERDEQQGEGHKVALGKVLFGHAQVDILRGQLDAAREHYRAALEAAPFIGAIHAGGIVEAQLALAENRYPEAEAAVRRAPTAAGDRVLTLPYERDRLLVEALIGQGKIDEARALLDKDKDSFAAEQSLIGKLTYGILVSSVKAGTRKPADVAESVRGLASLSSIANRHGIAFLARMADFRRGQILLVQGDASGAAVLTQVASEAGKDDMDLLATQAEKVLESFGHASR